MTSTAAFSAVNKDSVADARAGMFVAFTEELDRAGIHYCLLSGYESYPDPGDSDVDFMVGKQDAARMPGLLRSVARRTDALLVQAIQHETSAWYYVLVKEVGNEMAYFHPDCSTDYRRDGRLWLRSEDVLAGRRKLGSVFVPTEPDEFLYYVIKKVLKQEIDEEQLRRVRQLWAACPDGCCKHLRRFWSAESAGVLVSGILNGDVWRVRWHLPLLLAEMQASRHLESLPMRMVQQGREWWRAVERAMHPTGLSIAISGGSARQRDALAVGLEKNLRRAFRRSRIVDEGCSWFMELSWLARVRSTLAIRKLASAPGTTFARHRLCLDLSGAPPSVEFATHLALEWMAGRLHDG